MIEKECIKCGESKSLSDYYFNKNNGANGTYNHDCKLCYNATRNRNYVHRKRKAPVLKCKTCDEVNPEKFSKSVKSATGKQAKCKSCMKSVLKLYQDAKRKEKVSSGKKIKTSMIRVVDLEKAKRKDAVRVRFKAWCRNGGKFK